MNAKTLELVEFASIRDSVASYCHSEEGRALVLAAEPSPDPAEVARLRAFSMAFTAALEERETPALSFPLCEDLPAKLAKEGSCLELDEFHALALYARSGKVLRAWLFASGSEALMPLGESIPDCEDIVKTIRAVVDDEGKLRETGEIKEIRSRLRAINKDIEAFTASIRQEGALKNYLQSELPTLRDGRVVLALKAGARGRVKGIVHEVSGSGQTVFVEPEELVERNNRMVEEEARLRMAMRKALRALSERLRGEAGRLAALVASVAQADALLARGRYSRATRGSFAEAGESVRLMGARHPLLGPKAVPVDIDLGGNRVLVVTGPNTGGKTVSLKTLALLSLMAQFGLAIPAREGSVLPVFDEVLADIGDEQSISQSLSTFSGHMVNISRILAAAGPSSLVLLDELGSGTDPEEGAAIAMAILDELLERGPYVVLTTHHGILKNYGYTRPGVLNASMDFDAATLAPTYTLIMGVPGESHAIDIAGRVGLPAPLVERARSYLSEERADVSALIEGLKRKRDELDETARAREEERARLAEERRAQDLRELRLKQRERELASEAARGLRLFIEEARRDLEGVVRSLREGEPDKAKIAQGRAFVAELEARLEAESERVGRIERELESREGAAPVEIAVGGRVRIKSSGRAGRVIRAAGKGKWLVEAGSLKLSLPSSDLEPLPEAKAEAKVEVAYAEVASGMSPKFELRVIGMRLDEALREVEAQVDAASVSGLKSFSIIHGKGTGILQEGIHEYLRKRPEVEGFGFAPPEMGGTGKTFVTMR